MTKQPKQPKEPKTPTQRATRATTREIADRHQYIPAPELWRQTIEQLSGDPLRAAFVRQWLTTARLTIMHLPSGRAISAKVHTKTTTAADLIKQRAGADICICLQQLTKKQVILFVRGPNRTDGPIGWEADL